MKQIETKYNEAVQQIKSAILQSQLEAAKAVNRQMLALYYGIGKYVSDNTRTGAWGTGAIETISEQLRRELPGLRGFSPTSIKKMRTFYEQWHTFINRPPMADDLQTSERQDAFFANELLAINRSPMANGLDWHEFMSIRMLNDDERKPHENPTVGIVLCCDADKTYVEYLLQDYNQPMGVATYQVMPEKLKKVLPPEDEMKKLLFAKHDNKDDKEG